MDRLHLELLALTDPANGKVALGVRESKTVGDTEVRVRGEAEKLGPIVPRGFLSVLKVPECAENRSGASERPTRAGGVARERAEPAHPARDGQPDLAAPLWAGIGEERR